MTKITTLVEDYKQSIKPSTEDQDFEIFAELVCLTFQRLTKSGTLPVFIHRSKSFSTSDNFKNALKSYGNRTKNASVAELLREHECNKCNSFLRKLGSLVIIQSDGSLVSPLWHIVSTNRNFEIPTRYAGFIRSMHKDILAVSRDPDLELYVPNKSHEFTKKVSGEYHHFGIFTETYLNTLVKTMRDPSRKLKNPYQLAHAKKAKVRENYEMLVSNLGKFDSKHFLEVKDLIDLGLIENAYLIKPQLNWWLKLLDSVSIDSPFVKNLLWLHAFEAYEGVCNLNGSLLGSLLKDLQDNQNYESKKQALMKFRDRSKSTNYRRPEKVSVGNLKKAGEIFSTPELQAALARRHMYLDEVVSLWTSTKYKLHAPYSSKTTVPSPFDSFIREASKFAQPVVTIAGRDRMSWASFMILAESGNFTEIHYPTHTRMPVQRYPIVGLTTAVYPESENILKWSNRHSWYMYASGSFLLEFCLDKVSTPFTVTKISRRPCHWNGLKDCPSFDDAYIIYLEGMHDRNTEISVSLFPQTLRSEYHQISAAMEVYSNNTFLPEPEPGRATACGILVSERTQYPFTLTAVGRGGYAVEYTITSWK